MYLGGGIILHRCGVQTYSRRGKAGSLNLKLKQKSAARGIVVVSPSSAAGKKMDQVCR